MKVVICDIDGSVADLKHRLHYIKGSHKNYNTFFDEMVNDKPIKDVIEVLGQLAMEYKVVFMSGRPSSHRKQTEEWLKKHIWFYGLKSTNLGLYMRKEGDNRSDFTVKEELHSQFLQDYPEATILAAIEDRPRIVDLQRRLGITTLKVGDWDIEEEQPIPRRRIPTLTLLVGGSRSGKSSWVRAYNNEYKTISSDNIRAQMLSDWTDQSHNDAVFKYMREVVALRIKNGMDTIVDATNIRNKDRKEFLKIVDKDCRIMYCVFNRPLEDKIRDRGEIPEAVVRKHENVFQSNLKDILSGDGDERVEVFDMRMVV